MPKGQLEIGVWLSGQRADPEVETQGRDNVDICHPCDQGEHQGESRGIRQTLLKIMSIAENILCAGLI